jgi:hypothetical protein
MFIYEVSWHREIDKEDAYNDWWMTDTDYQSARELYESLSPAMIQELEGCSITVSLKAFKALDRYGYEVPEYYDEEIFYELWEMNGTPTLLDSKHS